jgi:hypothetical protein
MGSPKEVPMPYLYTFLSNIVALIVYLYFMSKADVKGTVLHCFCIEVAGFFGTTRRALAKYKVPINE